MGDCEGKIPEKLESFVEWVVSELGDLCHFFPFLPECWLLDPEFRAFWGSGLPWSYILSLYKFFSSQLLELLNAQFHRNDN